MPRTFPAARLRWPIAAALLALLFIGYGICLMSRSRALQATMAQEVRLLDDLSRLGSDLHRLGVVHRVDIAGRQDRWAQELDGVRRRATAIGDAHAGLPGADRLTERLMPPLAQLDSLHRQAAQQAGRIADPRLAEAVFQYLLGKAQKAIDQQARAVHEQGLAGHAAALSRKWDEAQALLLAACLLAVAMAWLVGARGRLLAQSRQRAVALDAARADLERTNRELRQTMLSKEEKEVMIKEIHHRVKNNLQIVKSLIRFQMDQVKDPRTLELFNECVNRVSAMALVHEQTYLTKDLANIPVDGYLRQLVRDLVHAYSVNIRLDLDIDIRVSTLTVDALVPMGLLVNEVISNSFKYAFPGRAQGTIIFHLEGSEAHGLRMRVGDDGVGLKSREGFHRPNSLGMDLIRTLAGQLDCDIHLLDGPGTQYELVSQKLRRKVA